MTVRRLVWRGERYVSVRDAASCYGVEVYQIEQWMEEELIELPRSIEGERAVPAAQLDRIALLVRYTRLLGLETDVIRLLLSGVIAHRGPRVTRSGPVGGRRRA